MVRSFTIEQEPGEAMRTARLTYSAMAQSRFRDVAAPRGQVRCFRPGRIHPIGARQ